ncbi:MAG: serine/threonine-protein kinase [Planctomycetota bacterium]|jgi:serine/threonine-protein kinase
MVEEKTTVGLPVGTKIGKYEVRERLGVGGQAIVYRCHDPLLDRDLAVKQISGHLAEDPKFLERFRKEAKILAKLGAEQPAIVTIYELVEDQRGLFIVMEYVTGQTLETILRSSAGPLEPKEALQIIWRLAAALNAVHGAGIIHRDIKPGNIIVSESLRAKITDFGVAASMSGQASMPLGTTKYMAPELFEGGEVDGRADMYSLGFIAYEMLIGREKFDEVFADVVRDPASEVLRWMKWHGNRSVTAPLVHEVNPEVPEPLSEIVAKMMAKDRNQRYANMEEFGRAIKENFSARARAAQPAAGAPGKPAGAGLEAEDLQIRMPEGQRPAAPPPAAEAQPEAQAREGVPTARIPKKKLSRKTKLIVAASAAGALFLALVVWLVVSQQRQAELAKRRVELFKKTDETYNAAVRYEADKARFEEARQGFEDVRKNFAGSKEAAKASVMVHMCSAYLHLLEEQWEDSKKQKDRAAEIRRELQAKWDKSSAWPREDFEKWMAESKSQLGSFDNHFMASQRFSMNLKLAGVLMDAIDRLGQARKQAEAGKAPETLNKVIEAGGLIAAVGDATSGADCLTSVAGLLGEAEKELRNVRQQAYREELEAIVGQAMRKVVPEVREFFDRSIGKASGSPGQYGADVDRLAGRVESAEEAVKKLGVLTLAGARTKREFINQVDALKGDFDDHINGAMDLASQGSFEKAEYSKKQAEIARGSLLDLRLPRDLPDGHVEELKALRRGIASDMNKAITDTDKHIKDEKERLAKEKDYKRALEAADLAKANGDVRAELVALERAKALKGESFGKELRDRLEKVKLAVQLEDALDHKREGEIRQAIAALEEYLKRDPQNKVALAALEECKGLARWADLIQKADADMSARMWADALEKLQEAKEIKFEQMLADKIAECEYQLGLLEVDKLTAEGDYVGALELLQKLRKIKPSAAAVIEARIEKVETLFTYSKFYEAGRKAMSEEEWLEARRNFGEAVKIYPEGELHDKAKVGLDKATFEEWIAKGLAQMDEGAYRTALACFKSAQDYARTEEETERVNRLIEAAEKGA